MGTGMVCGGERGGEVNCERLKESCIDKCILTTFSTLCGRGPFVGVDF